jgi:putative NADH-flavin reductase
MALADIFAAVRIISHHFFMKLLLLGATGRTGRHVLEQALQRRHTVHALVRNKQKVKLANPHLILFEGTPTDKAILQKAMTGCDAILSALNISRINDFPWAKLRTGKTFLSDTMRDLIDLAPQHRINRIIFTSAWGVAETKKDIPGWFRWLIDHSNIGHPYVDHARQEELVKESSLDFTSVRPAALTNTKKEQEIIVSFNNTPTPKLLISRLSVAKFMLDVVEKNLYVRQMPVISAR